MSCRYLEPRVRSTSTKTQLTSNGLTRLILDYPVLFPDARLRHDGTPDTVDRHALCPWRLSSTARIRMLGKDFGHAMDGVDLIEFADDGKIKTVVSFFATHRTS